MPNPGPDGKFPWGMPLKEGDRGGCYAGFAVLKERRICAMDFGTALTWVAMPVSETLVLVKAFRTRILEAFGPMSYDPSTFPLKVVANKEMGIIETHFPTVVGVLAANPEVFLVWADQLEAAAKEVATNSSSESVA